jgi:hypothetical protein
LFANHQRPRDGPDGPRQSVETSHLAREDVAGEDQVSRSSNSARDVGESSRWPNSLRDTQERRNTSTTTAAPRPSWPCADRAQPACFRSPSLTPAVPVLDSGWRCSSAACSRVRGMPGLGLVTRRSRNGVVSNPSGPEVRARCQKKRSRGSPRRRETSAVITVTGDSTQGPRCVSARFRGLLVRSACSRFRPAWH